MVKVSKINIILLLLLALTACENETYDSGDGKYSYLRADFGEIYTGDPTVALGAVTDEGDAIVFSQPYTVRWAVKADTTYRALVYYHVLADGKAQPQSVSRVPVITPYVTARPDTVKFDPLSLESTWVSKNGKYLNVAVVVKTGQADGIDALQTIGLMHDGEAVLADDTKQLRLRFIHDQAGVPQYYSSRAFVSLPLKDIAADVITLSVPTYDGWISRTISLE